MCDDKYVAGYTKVWLPRWTRTENGVRLREGTVALRGRMLGKWVHDTEPDAVHSDDQAVPATVATSLYEAKDPPGLGVYVEWASEAGDAGAYAVIYSDFHALVRGIDNGDGPPASVLGDIGELRPEWNGWWDVLAAGADGDGGEAAR